MTIRLTVSFVKMDFKQAQALAKKLEKRLQDLIDVGGHGTVAKPYITTHKSVSVSADPEDMKPTIRLMTNDGQDAYQGNQDDPR